MQRHPLDILSLLFGGLFLAVGIAGLAGPPTWLNLRFELLVPAVVILLGLGLLASARGQGRDRADAAVDDDRFLADDHLHVNEDPLV